MPGREGGEQAEEAGEHGVLGSGLRYGGSSVCEMGTTGKGKGGVDRSERRGLGMVGRSGRHWCAGSVGCCWVPAEDAGMTKRAGLLGVTWVRMGGWVVLGPGWGRRDDGGGALGMRAWTG